MANKHNSELVSEFKWKDIEYFIIVISYKTGKFVNVRRSGHTYKDDLLNIRLELESITKNNFLNLLLEKVSLVQYIKHSIIM